MIRRSFVSLGLLNIFCALGGSGIVPAAEAWCERSPYSDVLADNFYFSATNAEGAVGDIVAVEVSLTVDRWMEPPIAILLVASYDPRKLEGLGIQEFSEEYDRLVYFGWVVWLKGEVGPRHIHGQHGFSVDMNIDRDLGAEILGGGARVPLVTLFFRIVGEPGDTAEFRIADGEWVLPSGSCLDNYLHVIAAPDEVSRSRILRSRRHQSGMVRILPGEPTHTELAELPPSAKVYPEVPSPEAAQILFELSGGAVRPGARSVPLEVHVTSSHEFCGFMLALRFSPQLVQIASVEERVRPGAVWIDNERGGVGVLLNDSFRRIGQEGERVHVATLRVDVSPDATDEEIAFRFEPAGNYLNWLAIRYGTGGVGGAILPVVAQVAPLRVSAAALRLQARPTTLGDVNLDYKLDISDAVALLGYLFLGGDEPVCEDASDTNRDGRVNLSDAIAILNSLFSGGGDLADASTWCVGG